jgi:hypothetical protein
MRCDYRGGKKKSVPVNHRTFYKNENKNPIIPYHKINQESMKIWSRSVKCEKSGPPTENKKSPKSKMLRKILVGTPGMDMRKPDGEKANTVYGVLHVVGGLIIAQTAEVGKGAWKCRDGEAVALCRAAYEYNGSHDGKGGRCVR